MSDGDLAVEQMLRQTAYQSSKVFFLGPFAKRINFSAQQIRALNLVYALRRRSLLDHGKPIAVVGAGLSGLTAASALTLLGYCVHLFERNGEVLFRQRYASHRVVHPSIHAWPDHKTLDPTIHLPFFDWCADQCDSVMIGIAEEWNAVGRELVADHRLHHATKVIDYNDQYDGVTLTTNPSVRRLCAFGTVIFTIGFEDERTVDNVPPGSFWRGDEFERIRGKNPDARFIVTGIGDGGLIDSLRLAHERFYKGALIIQAATELFNSQVGRDISTAEREFRDKKIGEAKLEEIYGRCAMQLPAELADRLQASLVPVRPLVYLVSRHPSPYGGDAAPIHKLLIAHAIRDKVVEYVDGRCSIDAGRLCVIETDPGKPRPPVTPPIPNDAVVIRHGAPNALDELLRNRPDVLDHIRKYQNVLADDMINPFWEAGDLPSPEGAIYRVGDSEFIHDRFRRAYRMIADYWPHMRLLWREPNKFAIATKPEARDKWRPTELFGIKVDWEALFPVAQGL